MVPKQELLYCGLRVYKPVQMVRCADVSEKHTSCNCNFILKTEELCASKTFIFTYQNKRCHELKDSVNFYR
jgi:hypothetical protein